MPKVELMLSSIAMASFEVKRVIEIDTDEWMEMSPKEREERVIEEGEKFLRDNVDWDYKVL